MHTSCAGHATEASKAGCACQVRLFSDWTRVDVVCRLGSRRIAFLLHFDMAPPLYWATARNSPWLMVRKAGGRIAGPCSASQESSYEPADVQGVEAMGRTCVNLWDAVSRHGLRHLRLIEGALTPQRHLSEI